MLSPSGVSEPATLPQTLIYKNTKTRKKQTLKTAGFEPTTT